MLNAALGLVVLHPCSNGVLAPLLQVWLSRVLGTPQGGCTRLYSFGILATYLSCLNLGCGVSVRESDLQVWTRKILIARQCPRVRYNQPGSSAMSV
jgi:hypothetical protein